MKMRTAITGDNDEYVFLQIDVKDLMPKKSEIEVECLI